MDLLTKMDGSDREVTIKVDFGETREGDKLSNLRAALTERGVKEDIVDEVIASHAVSNLKVYFRSGAKSGMKATKERAPLTDTEIQEKIDKMVPTTASEREPGNVEKKLATAAKAFEGMDPEQQAKFMADLQARLKSAA